MMWKLFLLVGVALSVESYTVRDRLERLSHGEELRITVGTAGDKLEFVPAGEINHPTVLWDKYSHILNRGRLIGSGTTKYFSITKVVFDDEGTYTVYDFWKKEISSIKLTVRPAKKYNKFVAGEHFYINLEGVKKNDATLLFSGAAGNFTLVQDGARVSQDIPGYFDRVHIHDVTIEISHSNYSDEGHYTVIDRQNRMVSVTRMDLTDHHESSGGALMSLLLLLGIPAGICCCCRKKIFKKKPPTTATIVTSSEMVHVPPGGPVGPCPPYGSPGQPVNYYDPNSNMGPTVHPPPPTVGPATGGILPPSPGFNPAYPPQNVYYPPAGPYPGPPQNQYPPGPVGYVPVMSSYPPPAGSNESKEMKASSPADPLLNAPPQVGVVADPGPPPSTNALNSTDGGAYQFQIDKNTSNFL